MVDPRFFRRTGPHSVSEIAKLIGAPPVRVLAGEIAISDVAPLESANGTEISLFFDRRLRDSLRQTEAAAVVTSTELAKYAVNGKPLLIVQWPRSAYLQICELFHPEPPLEGRIDEAAQIHPSARLGRDCRVDAGAVVSAAAEIGAHSHIAHGALIGEGVVLGERCRVGANTVITHALIGSCVQIASGVSIGKPGFGFTESPRGLVRVAHLARVVIADDVEVGANCTIDRGVSSDTSIGAGTKLDNLVHVAHSVRIGCHCAIAGQVGIAGSTVIGDQVMIGGQAGISDHLKIGSRVRIASGSGVIRDIADNRAVGGYPAVPVRQWHRQTIDSGRRAGVGGKET